MLAGGRRLAALPGFLALAILILPYARLGQAAISLWLADDRSPWFAFDGKSLTALGTSLALGITVAMIAVLAATLVLVALWRIFSRLWIGVVLGAAALDFCLSPVVHLVAWRELTGAANLPGFATAVAVLSWKYFPLALAVLLLGLHALDAAGIEAGQVFSRHREALRRLVFPQLLPALTAAGTIILVLTFAEAEVPPLLGVRVYAEEFMARLALEADLGRTLPAALPFALAALVGWWLSVRSIAGYSVLSWDRSGLKPLAIYRRPTAYPAPLIGGLLILIGMPVLLLGAATWPGGFTGFLPKHGQALVTSAWLGGVSTVLTVMLGGMIATLFAAVGSPSRRMLLSILLLGLFMPGALTGLGMVALSQWPSLDWLNRGDTLLIVTHVLRLLPLASLLLIGLAQLEPPRWEEEIRLLGVPWWSRWRFIHAPLRWPRWLLIGGVLMALALSELSSTILVVAPGTETAVLRLYNLMHFGAPESVAALAFSQACLVILMLVLIGGATRWRYQDART